MVVDSLLEALNSLNLFCIGYSDDVVIVVKNKFINIIFSIMTEGLGFIERLCNTESLSVNPQNRKSVNPQKTTMVVFTNKKTLIAENISFFMGTLSILGCFLTLR